MGAAAISVAQECMPPGREFPFAFGGDGSTMLIDDENVDKVLEGLKGLQAHSCAAFGLALRVGRVRVAEIYGCGSELQVAKLEV